MSGVRYTALNPSATNKNDKDSSLVKTLNSMRLENGAINYAALDKLSGRRINEFKPADVNWFLSTFQCNNCLLGGGDTITTIGDLAESMPNEHFSQFPVKVERVSSILIDPQMGLLRRFNLNFDVEVAFVAPPTTDVSQFINETTRLVEVKARNGVIISGRHRLTSIMTMFEYGFGIPYEVYKNQRIRVRAYRFDDATRVVEAVQAANFTRTMSTAEKKNIQQQLKQGVGSTSSIEKQIDVFINNKKSSEKKLAFSNIFRMLTSEHDVTDLTRYSIAMKIYDELFSKASDEHGQKYEKPRFDVTHVTEAGLSRVMEIAVSTYQDGLQGVSNIARDGIKPASQLVAKKVSKEFKVVFDKPLMSSALMINGDVTISKPETKPVVEEPAASTPSRRRRSVKPVQTQPKEPVTIEVAAELVEPVVTSRRRVAKRSGL